ncbi:MAG: type I-E CRISPR-associated protein Cse2/CasB [bacterium]
MTEPKTDYRLSFDDSDVLSEVMSWWKGLNDQYTGERNRLRRSNSLDEVQTQKGFLRLRNRLQDHGSFSRERVALVSNVLSHVESNVDQSLAERMQGTVNERRFDRLLETDDLNRLATMMIRLIGLIDKRVSVIDCAVKLYFWSDNVKKELASEFYSHLR